jgi:hypothetical protein
MNKGVQLEVRLNRKHLSNIICHFSIVIFAVETIDMVAYLPKTTAGRPKACRG